MPICEEEMAARRQTAWSLHSPAGRSQHQRRLHGRCYHRCAGEDFAHTIVVMQVEGVNRYPAIRSVGQTWKKYPRRN